MPLLVWCVAVFAGIRECNVGLNLINGELEAADVYDGTQYDSVQTGFRTEECGCSYSQCRDQDCGTACHYEVHAIDNREFYLQYTGSRGRMSINPPIVTVTPLCNTDPSAITLLTNAVVRYSSLNPEEFAPIELDFQCQTIKPDTSGLFHVQVSVPVQSYTMNEFQNVTWSFRKACVAETEQARGLSIRFRDHLVVSEGSVTSRWNDLASEPFDVGYNPKNRDLKFSVQYRSSDADSGSIQYEMLPPMFDETVIKSVEYRGTQFVEGKKNTLRSIADETMTVRVICQNRPRRGTNIGDVVVGLTKMNNYAKTSLKSVEFKFQVECRQASTLTPIAILFIVIGLFVLVGFVLGYVYNLHFTGRRGLRAIPLVPTILSLVFKRPNKQRAYVVDDDTDETTLIEEEVMATVSHERMPEYGAL